MTTSEITQAFHLDLDKLIAFDGRKELSLVHTSEKLIEELRKKGFTVRIGSSAYCGCPMSILLSGDFSMQHKAVFSECAGDMGQFYQSGDYYIIPPKRE